MQARGATTHIESERERERESQHVRQKAEEDDGDTSVYFVGSGASGRSDGATLEDTSNGASEAVVDRAVLDLDRVLPASERPMRAAPDLPVRLEDVDVAACLCLPRVPAAFAMLSALRFAEPGTYILTNDRTLNTLSDLSCVHSARTVRRVQ